MTGSGVEFRRRGDRIRHRKQWVSGPDLAVAGVVLGWGALAHRFVPERSRPLVSALAAAGLAAAVRGSGVDARTIGCDPEDVPRGLLWGGATAAAVVAAVGGLGAHPSAGARFRDARVTDASGREALWHLLVRIPLATALVEELTFRGVLLGLGLRGGGTKRALAVSSLAFGVWHIGAALHPERTAATGDVVGDHAGTTAIAVAGDVVATTIAGLGFGWLRLRSGSVLAPALAHAALNATAYAATRLRSTSAR
jgi:membrane protease YdiL (CAAX protease family)